MQALESDRPSIRGKKDMKARSVPSIGAGFRSLTEQVYTALLEAIVERRLSAGQRLVLDDLAAQLEVSRTPVRVALTRLAAEGLVYPAGRMGYRVVQHTPEALQNLYDVRLMCESFAVEQGIEHVTPEVLDELEEVIIKPGQAGLAGSKDRLAQVLRDGQFHQRIVELARNRTLTEIYQKLNSHIHGMRVGPLSVSPEEQATRNNAEHRAIIEALRRKDRDAAKHAIADHIQKSAQRAIVSMQLAQDAA
jgi:DNA-binding GntR family transcriptional regulator